MRINTDFYTTAQEDITGRNGMKRFTKTFKTMILDGELPLNEKWDESISPFAINPRSHPEASYASDIPNKCWIFPDMNRLTGIASDTPEDPEMVLKPHIYKRQIYYPFAMYSGDGGQGNGWPFPFWRGRVGYDQDTETGDFTNYKWNLYGITAYTYNRLCWLIRVYVAAYGHNNASLTANNLHNGSWYNLGDVTDVMWSDILSGQKDITGVRFIPYYANASSLTSRAPSYVTGLYSLAGYEPLDGSASGLGILAPYTEEYIDYAAACYAAIGTNDGEGAMGGNPTLALGCIGEYGNNSFALKYREEWNWKFYDSLAAWANANFQEQNAYQKNGTDSVFWVNEPHQSNSYQYLYFRQHLNTDILTTKELCREYIITQCAYLGGYFTDKAGVVMSGALNDPDMYLGIIEEDGMTAGRYQRGTEIVDPEIDDPWSDIGWVPPVPDPDPNEYDDNTTVLNSLRLNPEFSTRYALTRTQLAHAHNFLMSEISTNVDSDFWSQQMLYTNDPMDVVQSVMLFPFDISEYQTDEPSYRDLSLGQLIDTGYQVQLNRESFCIINMGSCTYYPKMGNSVSDFRNYPPYSTALLYIPYCGSVEIDPNLYMGQQLSVKMIVDMGTGACLALVYRNAMVVDSISGTIGVTIPLTGIQTQTLAAAQRQAETQLKTAKRSAIPQLASGVAKIAAGSLFGGAIGMVGAAIYQQKYGDIGKAVTALENAQYDLEHINIPYKTIGTASSTTSWANERKCRLVIRRPLMLTDDLSEYAHTVGFACLTPGVVSDFTGYTEFEAVDLSGIEATAAEKDMLHKLLQGGVYI